LALEGIKDQLADQFNALWGRVQESSAYNSLKEQYESWPHIAQRGAAYGAGFLLVFLILSIPFSYISSSSVAIEEFNDHRALLRDLLRVSGQAGAPPPLPPGLSTADLQARVQGLVAQFGLIEEQVVGVTALGDRPAAALAPPAIEQSGVELSLKKLNLEQILDISVRLQDISDGTRLTGLTINANAEDNHYFDVIFKVVNFSIPIGEL
jgi:hypothetical protein